MIAPRTTSSHRQIRIAFEYLTKVPVTKIAEQEGISTQRVYQILQRVARLLGLPYIQIAEHNPDKYMRHLQAISAAVLYVDVAETPEEFFHEMLREQRRVV